MQETDKLKLRKPEYNEYADVADLNHNMNILDEKVDGKLGKTEKAANSAKFNGWSKDRFVITGEGNIIEEDTNGYLFLANLVGTIKYGKKIGLPYDDAQIINMANTFGKAGSQIAICNDKDEFGGMYYRNNTQNQWIELLDTREKNDSNPTTLATNNDANQCLETGKVYYCKHNQTAYLSFGTQDDGLIIPYMHKKNQFGFQLFMTWNSTSIWWRKIHGGNWSKWHCIGGGSWNQEIQKDSEQVSKFQRWEHYGKDHVIFDASKGIRPDGQPCDRTNSNQPWTAANCPTLMGFNGHATWGVRVDNARTADQVQGFPFRNNNGMLEVLVNGVWMAVGGQIYNRILTTTGGGIYNSTIIKPFGEARNGIQNEYQEGQEVVIIDWRKPSKILSCGISNMNVGSNMGYGYQGIRLASIKVYYDDVLVHDIPIGNDISLFNRIDGAYIEVRRGFKIIGKVSKINAQAVHPQVGINALYYEG